MSDYADWKLLMLANDKGKFALELGLGLSTDLQGAFERGIDEEWFTLVDVSDGLSAAPGRLMRVFRLTAQGWARRNTLKDQLQ